MLVGRKSFRNKTIGELNNYNSYRPFSGGIGIVKLLIIICCILIVFFIGKYIIKGAQILGGYIGKGAVHVVSSTMGDDMIKDDLGNINVMIVGYGGEEYAGGYLADSIMVASFNPQLGAVTMLSVPRDFLVYNKETNIIGRINAMFSHTVGRKKEFNTGAKVLKAKLEEIMGLKIPYYAMVDFNGFEKVIDTLGGITVDVQKTIYDVTYPDGKGGYMTVHINSGVNVMDGTTALQYARSRHSTSDFARSLRQQQIVQAIINKFKENGLGNINRLKQLYADYTNMVITNITLQEILGMARYANKMKHMFLFGYTVECSNINYKHSYPGCFLYNPPRALFNGASVIIPYGGAPGQIGFYEYTKQFAFFVMHNQEYLIENQAIGVLNGIDKNYARSVIRRSDGFANQIAVKLKKYAFNVLMVQNFSYTLSGTTVFVLGTGNYQYTVDTLKNFVNIDNIITTPDPLMAQQYTGLDLLLVLGNSYIDQLATTPFNYYK